MTIILEMPGFFTDAEAASSKGQRMYLALNRIRLCSAVVGALGGVLSFSAGGLDGSALVALVGFVIALIAELVLSFLQPERDWYAGRALAESVKTMVWRYAVQGEPFTADLSEPELHHLLRSRVQQLTAKGADRVAIGTGAPLVTNSMVVLRRSSFAVRQTSYLEQRTAAQRHWYAQRARFNKSRADLWRIILVTAEILAVVFATLKISGGMAVDLGGLFGAFIAAGAAWLGLKQHAQLASAYNTTSRELALQEDVLLETAEDMWPRAVSDAEEAISREHTMWLASRG